MPIQPLAPGDPVRLSRFELLGRLGAGGQGVVYLGRGPGPGEERVAVKVLRAGVDPMAMERLARELEAIHQIQPFVTAGVIEVAAEDGRQFIVSEFIDGPSLEERVESRGPLPGGELHRLAIGTATALAAIHGAGVVHRDFKPANVLLGPDGPRVVDFGIARLTDAATITSGIIGTPAFMSPEQLSGQRPTSAVDIFAWAVTIVFAATGSPAFRADTIPAVMHRILFEEPEVSGVPLALRAVVSECLSKDPELRPSARDLMLRLVDPAAAPAGVTPGAGRMAPSGQAGPAGSSGPAYSAGRAGLTAPPGADPEAAWSPATVTSGHQPGRLADPTHPAPPARVARRSRRAPVLIGGGAVVAAAAVAGILLFPRATPTRPSNPPAAGTGTLAPAPASTSASPPASTSASPPAATGPAIPAAYAGTWGGTAQMTSTAGSGPGLNSSITFTFATGARTVHEVNDTCVNTLTLTLVTASQLTFSEPGTAECVAGTVTFRLRGAKLDYRWFNDLAQNVGALARA
jgi:eukaryotic-like serine/threonine-protein kinase